MTDTIYTAPRSDLVQPRSTAEYGSLERGIAGDYPFSIRAILGEAWQRTNGAKLTLMMAGILYFAIYVAVAVGLGMVSALFGVSAPEAGASMQPVQVAANIGVNLVVGGFGTALGMGIFLMGVRRAVDAPITVTMLFESLPQFVPIFVTMLLMYLMVAVGLVLLVIPGIYLAVAYYLAVPLVVEKKLGAWQALETSRKAVSKRWFRSLGLAIVLGLVNLGGFLALGIGLIWTLPMSIIAFGIWYRNVFGVEPSTAAG